MAQWPPLNTPLSLPPKKFLFEVLMTLLHVICGLAPLPIKNPSYAYAGDPW